MKIVYADASDKLASNIRLKTGSHEAIVSAVELKYFRKVAEQLGITFEQGK